MLKIKSVVSKTEQLESRGKWTFPNEVKRDFWDDGDACVKYDENKESYEGLLGFSIELSLAILGAPEKTQVWLYGLKNKGHQCIPDVAQ